MKQDLSHVGAVIVPSESMPDVAHFDREAAEAWGKKNRDRFVIPEDAEYVLCGFEWRNFMWMFVFSHPTFPLRNPFEIVHVVDSL